MRAARLRCVILGLLLLCATAADPYRVLGLRNGATDDDVRKAYRKLAKRYHPDRVGVEGTAKFREISEAYEHLTGKNPANPAAADRGGGARYGGDPMSSQGRGGGGRRGFTQMFRGPDGRIYTRVVYYDEEPAFSYGSAFRWEMSGQIDPALVLGALLLFLMGAIAVIDYLSQSIAKAERTAPTTADASGKPPPPPPSGGRGGTAPLESEYNGDTTLPPLSTDLLRALEALSDAPPPPSDESEKSGVGGNSRDLLLVIVPRWMNREELDSRSDFRLIKEAVRLARLDLPDLRAAWVAAQAEGGTAEAVVDVDQMHLHVHWYRRLKRIVAGRAVTAAPENPTSAAGAVRVMILVRMRLSTQMASACVIPGDGTPSITEPLPPVDKNAAFVGSLTSSSCDVGDDRAQLLSDAIRDACDGKQLADVTDLLQELLPSAVRG